MDFKKHLETAWNLTLTHIVNLLLMTLVMLVISCLTLGILAPVTMAGYMNAILLMMREGREPRIEDLFSQMRLFLPLLVFFIVVLIATMVGFMLLVLPGLAIIIAVTFACLYMVPLMVDKTMGLIDAAKSSWRMAFNQNVADHVVVVILFVGLMAIGSAVFIGTLLTTPFATVFLISVYLEKVQSIGQVPADAGSNPPPPPGLDGEA